ncbi:hypothetical protein [Streptomyces sp. XD-27]|uniref:hypothetical protein n=1 Tax=Streptomyces sp. XD-27 TaxID=3062779 RepID=UPI0026F456AF|nr:hypothetical protein [Streptomyces sp. XD-27]WKX70024.1 hypothetical protein Q3Y56_08970 [Streptomyces sp. XD-27]
MTDQPSPQTLANQKPSIAALASLTEIFGHLPMPYITVSTTGPMVGLQLPTPCDFKTWREGLQVKPCSVTLNTYSALGTSGA